MSELTICLQRLWFKHFLARVFCLIVLPVTVYMGLFAIHFVCLVNPGDGDGFMSSEFQATLNSKAMVDVPVDVILGSRVSIRHHNTQGGYLHSHNHMYPTGSKQQQITLYPHKDDNNVWLLENQTQPLDVAGAAINGSFAWDKLEPTMIVDGTVLRLLHRTTERRLHSHDVRPPVTEAEWQNEASAYGYEGFEGDANDYFRVEIVKSMSDGAEAKKRLRTIQTKFKLVHVMTGCSLFSHKVKLPEWGFEQQEVTCAKQGTLPNSIWYIESNEHPILGADAEKVNYRNPGFFGKFWELQTVMWKTNAGLVESHAWDSRPPSWPFLLRGINFWGKDHRQIYLIGNPVIWWSSTAAVAIYLAFKAFTVLRWQRGYKDYDNPTFKRFDYEIGMSFLGWAFHYFPFYLMQRQLFLHHYFPALYFAILVLCQIYDFTTNRIRGVGLRERPLLGQSGVVVFLAISIAVFTLFAPLSYGNPWTQSACKQVKLLDTWDWDCNNFHTDVRLFLPKVSLMLTSSQLSQYSFSSSASTPVAQPTGKPAAPPPADVKVETPPSASEQVVTSPAPAPAVESVVNREERIEYRDQDGNLLNEEQVKALSGKVEFSTRYETRTRVLDGSGNEIGDGQPGAEGFAPPHPDVEREPNTKGESLGSDGPAAPASVSPEQDLEKEKSVEEAKSGVPRPASENLEATK